MRKAREAIVGESSAHGRSRRSWSTEESKLSLPTVRILNFTFFQTKLLYFCGPMAASN